MSVVYINSYQFAGAPSAPTTWNIGITIADTSFALLTGAVGNFNVDWGDGQIDNNVSVSGNATTSHTYASSGSYVVKITLNSGVFYPRYAANAQAVKIRSLGATPTAWSFGTSLSRAFWGATGLTSISNAMDVSNISDFSLAWLNCTSLTSFPLLNTVSATTVSSAWQGCSSLTSFPVLNTENVTSMVGSWRDCSSLTSFPLLNISKVTTFQLAWRACSGLTTFPPGFFDSWTATPGSNCFVDAWDQCSSLTAASVENILNSINTSGRSAPAIGPDITIDYNASSGTPNISTAVTSLKSRGWTITLNGVAQ